MTSQETKNITAHPGLERSVITSRDQASSSTLPKAPPELSSAHDFPPLVAPSKPQPAAEQPPKDAKVKNTVPILTDKAVVPAPPIEAINMPDLTTETQDVSIVEKSPQPPKAEQPVGTPSASEAASQKQYKSATVREGSDGDQTCLISKDIASDQVVAQVRDDPPQMDTAGKQKVEPQSSLPTMLENSASKDAAVAPQPPTSTIIKSLSTEAPAQRPPPLRTIKVVASAKESRPRPTPLTTTSQAQATQANVQPSRQASVASLSVPGTPMDTISDIASLTSTSASRPGSPPLGRVGSAPVRQTTKSQQKKERQARKLAEAVTQSEESKALTEEVVQAPIIPRKKKSKKEPVVKAASVSEEPQTLPSTAVEETKTPDVESSVSVTPIQEASKPAQTSKKAVKKPQEALNESTKQRSPTPQTPPQEEAATKASTAASAIFAELLKAQEILASALDFFKPVSSFNHRHPIPEQDPNILSPLPPLTLEQIALLDADEGVIIRTTTDPAHPYPYAVVCPDRYVMKNLTKEECERYVKGRKTIISGKGPSVFRSTNYPIEPHLHRRSGDNSVRIGAQKTRTINDEMMARNVVPFSTRRAQDDLALMEVLGYGDLFEKKGVILSQEGAVGEGRERAKGREVMSIEEAEATMLACRKETEALEKKLNTLIRKNRRLMFGNGN